MSYLPPEKNDKSATTPTRIAIWVLAGGVGAYMLVTGIIGIVGG